MTLASRLAMPRTTIHLSFDRGTLRFDNLGPHALPGVVWDARVDGFRAAAYRYHSVLAAAASMSVGVVDEVAFAFDRNAAPWTTPTLRPYQEDSLRAWRAFGARGVVAMPTGSGKTILAVAALAQARAPSLVLCPTRALLEQWERELARWYQGPIGVVGDGERRVEDVTVMTFESAFRQLDVLGDRFRVVVVDEAHHFASGIRAEALEMCVAPMRLGLTATAPTEGSAGAQRLAELIGPTVCEIAVGELLGTHLAELELTRLSVRLDPDEADDYERSYRPFAELRATFMRANPGADWVSCMRAMSRSAAGRAAISGYHRAVALASFPRAKRTLVAALLARHRDDKSLVFTASTDDAYAIALEHLIPVVTAETDRAERAEILARFRDGTYRAIVSARVLNEGIDVPDARVAIVAAGRFGEREHVQRIGRVLRPAAGKRALVYELVTAGTLDDGRARARGRRLAAREAALV